MQNKTTLCSHSIKYVSWTWMWAVFFVRINLEEANVPWESVSVFVCRIFPALEELLAAVTVYISDIGVEYDCLSSWSLWVFRWAERPILEPHILVQCGRGWAGVVVGLAWACLVVALPVVWISPYLKSLVKIKVDIIRHLNIKTYLLQRVLHQFGHESPLF